MCSSNIYSNCLILEVRLTKRFISIGRIYFFSVFIVFHIGLFAKLMLLQLCSCPVLTFFF